MKYYLASGSELKLSSDAFLAQGGEGSIYVQHSKAYKIYHDITQVLPRRKLTELQCLQAHYFLSPEDMVWNEKDQPVGYQMPFVSHIVPLGKLINPCYKTRHNITTDTLLALLEQLRQGIEYAHQRQILLVDINDQNFLVSHDHQQLYFVDVDSYQTSSFSATAVMDSVRDWQVSPKDFSVKSDWFSFAVLSVQLLIGIHPYKGKHPTIKGLKNRMLQSISIFDDQVSIPKICPSLDLIPAHFSHWLQQVLQEGTRSIPPSPITTTQTAAHIQHTPYSLHSTSISMTPLQKTSHPIITHSYVRGKRVLLCDQSVVINDVVYPFPQNMAEEKPLAVIFDLKSKHPILVVQDGHHIKMRDIVDGSWCSDLIAFDQIYCTTHHVHILHAGQHIVLSVRQIGSKRLLVSQAKRKVMRYASTLFAGGILQNMLGAYTLTAFDEQYPLSTITLSELAHVKVLDAYYANRILHVSYRKGNQQYLGCFRFDSHHHYHFEEILDVELDDISFVVTSKNVAIWLRSCGSLELFHYQTELSQRRVIVDALQGDERLLLEDDQVLLLQQTQLSAISLH